MKSRIIKNVIIIGTLVIMTGCSETVASSHKIPDKSTKAKKTAESSEIPAEQSTPVPTPTLTPIPVSIPTPTPVPVCDGIGITSACQVNGVKYSKYVYHPAVPEQFHMETRSYQEQVVTGYCTLCNDGTWSPTCAVGRGACSHHGGVAQYNAPKYGTEIRSWQEKVVDSPAQDAYYEMEVAPE